MNVLVTGASGLIGRTLVPRLEAEGRRVYTLAREKRGGDPWWDPESGTIDFGDLDELSAVVHLAGENIAQGRWTRAKKDRIRQSRVEGTRLLVQALKALSPRPSTLISASAVGFYGDRGDKLLNEQSEPGSGFLASVCQEWEAETAPAAASGIRVVLARFGVVLSAAGGAIRSMELPFRLGLGGAMGPGTQYLSWITAEDVAAILQFLLNDESISGPVNVVSPNPVTNREFTKALGRVFRRPAVLAMPTFAARLLFGEVADQLLLSSARVTPEKLLSAGYAFQHPELNGALEHLFRTKAP
ncbi:MAG: TIGR01777 family oxidoreductase [Planctomycetota bacterium]